MTTPTPTFSDPAGCTMSSGEPITKSDQPIMHFEYDHLCVSASKRLLKVLPTKPNDLIQIQLWQGSDAVPYRCLSYTWGAPTPMFPLKVNGRTMHVGKNLHEFLDVAVERFANELLWMDAICINQKDDTEKSVQVQRMGDTFKEATEGLQSIS